jgi:hypothetical protein
MDEPIENLDSPNEEEVVIPEKDEPIELGLPADPVEVEPKDEDTADSDALKQKNQELYEQLKKAKGFIRGKDGKWVKKEVPQVIQKEVTMPGDITRTELYSLVKANVPEEDTQKLLTYARSNSLTVTEYLKTDDAKALLRTWSDQRKAAEAVAMGSSRYGASKVSEEALVKNASKGILPTDEEGIEKLVKATIGINKG